MHLQGVHSRANSRSKAAWHIHAGAGKTGQSRELGLILAALSKRVFDLRLAAL